MRPWFPFYRLGATALLAAAGRAGLAGGVDIMRAPDSWLGKFSRFLGFHPGGRPSFSHSFDANLACNGISPDGRYATCQTLSSPGSPGDTIVALFDLQRGEPLARLTAKGGTADRFEFDSELGQVHILTRDGDRETYGFDGRMVDRPAWVARRIARGDLAITGEIIKSADGPLDASLAEHLLSGLRYGAAHSEP
jgi:hypothetical protein